MSKKKARKTSQPRSKYSGSAPKRLMQHSPPSGVQSDRNQKLQCVTDQVALAAAITRFRNLYPNTTLEDWQDLLSLEALLSLPFYGGAAVDTVDPTFLERQFQADQERQERGMPGAMSTGLACKGIAQVDEVLTAVVELIDAFYTVFHLDWVMTKRCIANADAQEHQNNDSWFGKEGTFANPTIADVSKDWGNRARLLSAYNKILGILQELEDRAEQAGEFSYHLHTIAFDPVPPCFVCED